jgi:copper homeostasis protein (lipoprotein)
MRRFMTGLVFCGLLSGLSMAGSAQAGKVGGAGSAAGSSVPLEKTEWRLVRLGDVVVKVEDLHRQPQLVFDPSSHRVSGSGGCNRIVGGYELNAEKLTFGQMASTMMACAGGMETEQSFLKALGEVKRWKIAGHQLELMDGAGKVVAVFEAGDSGAK